MLAEGNLGKKTGRGYFDWSAGRPEIDPSKATDRLDPLWPVFVQINEAAKLIEQGVCSADDVDLALVNSSGNPVGPMSVGRGMSRVELADQLEWLARRYDKEIFMPTRGVIDGRYTL
jgi:enoyl-CoA hydratase/3-hydroxyacyl-CoA dehydrogenase